MADRETYAVHVAVRVFDGSEDGLRAGAEVNVEAASPELAAILALTEAQVPMGASLAIKPEQVIGGLADRVGSLFKSIRIGRDG